MRHWLMLKARTTRGEAEYFWSAHHPINTSHAIMAHDRPIRCFVTLLTLILAGAGGVRVSEDAIVAVGENDVRPLTPD